jgi:hypothetical protein
VSRAFEFAKDSFIALDENYPYREYMTYKNKYFRDFKCR